MSDKTILLVEDEAPKLRHISNLVKEIEPGVTLLEVRSVNSALDQLESTKVDVLLLDMSLPTFDVGDRESGGRPQGFGGIEVLRHMTMAGIDCPCIVITGYEGFKREDGETVDLIQLKAELESEFPELLRGVLHYNSRYDEWQTVLASLLSEPEHGATN